MTFHLVHLAFDPTRAATMRIIGNPYVLHQFVYETMWADGDPGRLLYRLEANAWPAAPAANAFHNSKPCVLVQAENLVVPQILKRWEEKSGFSRDFVRIRRKSFVGTLRQSGVYRFRTRVNPVRSQIADSAGVRGKRMGIWEPEAQLEWFAGRLADSGMRLVQAEHRREPYLEIRQSAATKPVKKLFFASAFFEGIMEVTNAERAEKAILEGIGPGKGFGFGMLSIARSARSAHSAQEQRDAAN